MNSSLEAPKIARPTMVASLILAALILALVAGSALAAALVKNGSFEKDNNGDGIPNKWGASGSITSADKRVCNQAKAGSCSFKMSADGIEKSIFQTVAVSGFATADHTLALWTKGKDLDLSGGAMRIFLRFNHIGLVGSTNHIIDVPAGSSPWTKRSVTGASSADIESITISVITFATSGKAWFDQVKLTIAP
jgi:hypothetical protein